MKIQYDGSRYKGWQRLLNGENTIQGKVEEILSLFFEKEIKIIGCSRTDAGVHARGQIANFYIEDKIRNEIDFLRKINKKLPEDISIKKISNVNERFHSRHNAKRKTYSYSINRGDFIDPFNRKYELYIEEKLDVEKMVEASRSFLGEHNFSTFTNAKSKKKSMVREIYEINFLEKNEILIIEIKGNGFLHNMIRRMVGVLILVGKGENKPSDIIDMLKKEDRGMVSYIAEAKGLCLEKVEY